MRKSRTKTGFRLRAGIAVAAATAAVVAGTALPAYAATVTVGPTQVAAAGGTNLYFYGGTLATKGLRFITPTASTCPAEYDDAAAPQTTVVDAGALAGGNGLAWTVTPALAAGSWKPCFYLTTSASTAGAEYTADTTAATITSLLTGSLSASSGSANARITMTVPGANFTTAATYSAHFISGVTACPSPSVATDTTHLAATTTRATATTLNITVPAITASTPYLVCVYNGTAAGSTLLVRSTAFSSYSNTLPQVTISPSGGSSGKLTNLLVTGPTTNPIFSGSPQMLVSRNACPVARPVTSGNSLSAPAGSEAFIAPTTKITTSKLAVSVPTSVLVNTGDVTTPYNLCLYAGNSTDDALVAAPVTYSVAPVLNVGSATFAVGNSSPTSTASGPAQGGSTITIAGVTGVPSQTAVEAGATFSATLGGSPINNLKVNANGSFTGQTSAHAPGPVKLAVTTAAGTETQSAANYTYSYGITVMPNTAASNTTPVLDITGAGFGGLSFADACPGGTCAAADAAKSYVLLTNNAWNAQTFSNLATPWSSAAPPAALCNSVLAISDTEIICTLDLGNKVTAGSATTNASVMTISSTPDGAGNVVPPGTYTVTVVNDSTDIDAGDSSIVSSGSTFTVAPF